MKICNYCGAKLNGTEKFCNICGKKLEYTDDILINSDDLNTTTSTTNTDETNTPATENHINNDDSNIDNTIDTNDNNSSNNVISNTNSKNNKFILISIFIIAFIIGGTILGVKIFLTNKFSAENTILQFEKAITSNDKEKLLNVISSNSSQLSLDNTSAQAIIDLLSTDTETFDNILQTLNKDATNTFMLKNESSNNSDYKLFSLTIVSSNFFYTKYSILVQPVNTTIKTNSIEAKVNIGDKKFTINEDINFEENFSLAPGLYNLNFKSTDTFNNTIEDNLSINTLKDDHITAFADYNMYTINSNISEANIFINGVDTNISVKNAEDFPIMLKSTDELYLSYTIDDTNFTTDSYYPSTSSNPIYLDFDTYTYYKIQQAIANSDDKAEKEQIALKYINKYKDRDFIIPTSNTVTLGYGDLQDYSAEELFLARNEILARNGYAFNNLPILRNYFDSKSWYTPDYNFSGELTDQIEIDNFSILKTCEFSKLASENCPEITSDYVFPNSNTIKLSSSTIKRLNDWELVVARNEIFARYGLEFSTLELLYHFQSKDWYSIDPTVDSTVSLNSIEKENVQLLLSEENKRKNTNLNYDLGEK